MNPSQINPSPSRVFHRLMYLLQKFDEAPWSSWTSWLNKKSSTPKSQEACNKTHQKKNTKKKHLMCEKARTYTCIHYNFYIYILPINIGLYVSMNICIWWIFSSFGFMMSTLGPWPPCQDLQTWGAGATAGDSSGWVESTHLKNMQPSNWIISISRDENNWNIWVATTQLKALWKN